MAKYIDAEKLIVEIKRLIKVNQELKSNHFTEGIAAGYGDVLSVIDSLQQERQPEVDLEKELDKYLRGEFKQTAGGNFNNYIQVARHFYELGQRRAAEMYDEIEYNRQRAVEEMSDKTLGEAAEGYANETTKMMLNVFENVGRYEGFKDGAKWQKEQMMKEAVEGEIENASLGIVYLRKNLVNEGHSTGDKVRIIIVKGD